MNRQGRGAPNWQQVIWRAWRNEQDEEIATRLYSLVVGQPAGVEAAAILVVLGVFYGAAVGLLVKVMLGGWTVKDGQMAWRTLPLSALAPFLLAGGALVGMLALLVYIVRKPRPTWRRLLARLAPMIAPALPPLQASDTGPFMVGIIGGILAGPLGGAFAGGLAQMDRRTTGRSWERAAGVGVIGGLLGGLIMLSILALAEPVAILSILGLLAVTLGQVAGLFLGLDLGLVGGLLFGALAGSLGGVIVGHLFHPVAGLVAGACVVLINGVVSLLRDSPQIWRWRALWFWWSGRPTAAELEVALRQAVKEQPDPSPWASPLERLDRSDVLNSAMDLALDLRHRQWGDRFAARQRLAALGGEAVQVLRALARPPSRQQRTARWLLQSIAAETTARLAGRMDDLLCPQCLVRCSAQQISLPGPDLHYYGCRACGQSREFLEWPGPVVAVLDRGMDGERIEHEGTMEVNWLQRRALFDFDRVEIGPVDEEEVERFAVQVANDTDPFRRGRYREMACAVRPGVELPENTLRILDSLFGPIERRTL